MMHMISLVATSNLKHKLKQHILPFYQHRQLEKYESRLAELSQCCLGTNSDVSGLRASISATLHSHAAEAAQMQEQRDERKRKQMRFDLDRVVAAMRVCKRVVEIFIQSNIE